MSISIPSQILAWLAQKQLFALNSHYQQITKQNLPIIVVTGTVGKSSTTLLISQYLQANGYQVVTGTSEQKNLNTLTGVVMSLAGIYIEFANTNRFQKFLAWSKLLSFGVFSSMFPRLEINQDMAIVMEVGYDFQGESAIYKKIFERIDLLVVTATTWEHNQGFNKVVDSTRISALKDFLPDSWVKNLDNGLIDSRLRNIAIEQVNLCSQAEYIVLPEKIGEITNTLLTNSINSDQTIQKLQSIDSVSLAKPKFLVSTAESSRINGILCSDKLVYNSKYLLPKSFARTSLVLQCVANCFELEGDLIAPTLQNCILPYGRFGYFNGLNQTKIVDSTYNSDPSSLGYFLDTLEEVINSGQEFGQPTGHTLILGEMRELGNVAKVEHCKILDRLIDLETKYPEQIINIYLIGQEWSNCGDSDSSSWFVNYSGKQFKRYATAGGISKELTKNEIKPQSWFWVKGSQNTIFLEIVVEALLANSEDKKYLCRQEPKWESIKSNLK